MNETEHDSMIASNPIRAAIDAGLTFPILAKIVGANGGTGEVLWEEKASYHVISAMLPISYPFRWTLTGSNRLTLRVTQMESGAQEVHDHAERWAS